MKHFLILATLISFWVLSIQAQVIVRPPSMPFPNHYPAPGRYYPSPYPMPLPAPVYVPPVYIPPSYVYTCYVQNPYTGLTFYGVGYDMFAATQRAQLACQMAGYACVYIGCR